jgi:hypothetical protein
MKNMKKITIKIINVKKVLEFLRTHEKINFRHLFDVENIVKGDKETIVELLIDIHNFYCKNENMSNGVTNRSKTKASKSLDSVKNLKSKSKHLQTLDYDDYRVNLPNNIYVRLNKKFSGNKNISKQPSQNIRMRRKDVSSTADTKINSSLEEINKTYSYNPNNDNIFLTFDSKNAKKLNSLLEKSISGLNSSNSVNNFNYNDNKTKISTSTLNSIFTTRKKILKNSNSENINLNSYCNEVPDKKKKRVNFLNLTNTNIYNSPDLENMYSRDLLIVDELKDWLLSLGINFAKKINFNKNILEEFKDG